jgi:hypothetical protein
MLLDADGDGIEDILGAFSRIEPKSVRWIGAWSGAAMGRMSLAR